MTQRLRVGFVIELDPGWLGGINYFRNLITAIYDDPQRTIDAIFFIGRKADIGALSGLPVVETVRTPLLDRGTPANLARRLAKRISRRDLLLDRLLQEHRIDALSHSGVLGPGAHTPVAYWIADFQHIHLPEHFTDAERASRNAWFARVCAQSRIVIVSSEHAQADLVGLYPEVTQRAEVLRFVPELDVSKPLASFEELGRRYGFTSPYIYLPNQYWAHKNHQVVIEAIGLLAREGKEIRVVSTGNPADYRNPHHYETLCARIATLGIEDRYIRLGVVPYADLLALMRYSVCLINPSLFEGWSTTVEEARAMDKFIILSDIPVHREQSPAKSAFFDPHDARALAELMWERWHSPASDLAVDGLADDHVDRRRAFSRTYHQIMQRVTSGLERSAA